MGTLTIRDLDDALKQKLRERAAARGISMEREARQLLARAVAQPRRTKSILDDLRRLGARPPEPFDQKKVSDEMWDKGLR